MSREQLGNVLKRGLTAAVLLGRRAAVLACELGRRLAAASGPACAQLKETLLRAVEGARARVSSGTGNGPMRWARRAPGNVPGLPELQTVPISGSAAALSVDYPSGYTRRVFDRSLVIAFLISLAIHGTLYSGWRWGKSMGWWEHQATWLLDITKKAKERGRPAELAQPTKEIPLTFVDVDPAAAAAEPPKDAKYYGAANSIAANPQPQEKVEPKIEGKQTEIVRVQDTPRLQPQPLQPSVAPAPAAPETPVESPKTEPGVLPDPNSVKIGVTESKPQQRPRTLADARRQQGKLAGERMLQDGGARRRGQVSLDVKATPFGAYDAAFIAAVQQRWYDLIDSTRLTQKTGKVILEFRLNHDGRITDLTLRETEVGEMLGLLCQRAVLDPAPYPTWPSDMWRMVGKDYRDVVFTFYYY